MIHVVLRDVQWSKVERTVWARRVTPGGAAGITGFSWKQFCGRPAPAARGVIFRPNSATGAVHSDGLATGRRLVFSSAYSRQYRKTPTWNIDDRRHHRSGPSSWTRCKRGTQNQAIGKSKGGWTTKTSLPSSRSSRPSPSEATKQTQASNR